MAEPREAPENPWLARGTMAVGVIVAWVFLGSYIRPELLLMDTMPAGGDTPSFLRPVQHLRDVLIPAGNPQGFDLGNFAGYAPYQFYFLPPSLLIVALSTVLPLNVAFKIVTALGSYLLPLMTTLSMRAMGFSAATAAVGASASLLFLFNEGNSMWGGNIPSTLAGEFAHSLGFAFAVLFIGVLYRGIVHGKTWQLPAAVLAFAGLCHPVAFLNGVTPGIFFLFDRKRFVTNLRYLIAVYFGAVLLMAFWLVPLMVKIGYATSINWKWHFATVWDLLPRILWPVLRLAALALLWTLRPKTSGRARKLIYGGVAAAISLYNPTDLVPTLPGIGVMRWVIYPVWWTVRTIATIERSGTPIFGVPPAFAVLVLALLVLWGLGAAGALGYGSTASTEARPGERPARYLVFGILVTAVCFFNGTEVGLPEIRFVPFAYLLAILLALDLVTRALRFARAPHLAALPLAAILLYWVHGNTSFIPSWLRWNYEGLERKPSWELLHSMMDAVRGTISEPRVAYENSPGHERFGSMRVFEDMALLSGRATLEGVLLQTDINSPYIYWLQSQISVAGTGVIPGYSYPSLDPVRGTNRLALYNAHDMIAVTKEVTEALDKDPRWERKFTRPPYVIFHMKDADPHYVRVPRFRPVMVPTTRWKHDFHHWFATDAALDVPVVDTANVPPEERDRFVQGRVAWEPPHEPITAKCEITERIDHLAIDFTTTCPGQPHWIAVSYYPNWKVEGASRIYLATPAFMLVFPDGPEVHLRFRRLGVDWFSIGLSLLGLALCLAPGRRFELGDEPTGATARLLARFQRPIVIGATVLVVGVTAWNIVRDAAPDYFYKIAWKAFEKEDYTTSRKFFERAMLLGGDSSAAADATFFRAASLLRSNQPRAAREGYQLLIDKFPDSVWVTESHFHVGLTLRQIGKERAAKDKFRWVVATYPGNRWAEFSAKQINELRDAAKFRARQRHG